MPSRSRSAWSEFTALGQLSRPSGSPSISLSSTVEVGGPPSIAPASPVTSLGDFALT
jgi:hypothetical protein